MNAFDPIPYVLQPPCNNCGRPMRRRTVPPDGGRTVVYCGKGRCHSCANRARYRRLAADARPSGRRVAAEVVLGEYAAFTGMGVSVRDIPSRLGMTPGAFERCMRLARRRGDVRAAGWCGFAAAADVSWGVR